ncbi:hypothetical protein [Salinivibrio sp. YCSC6]|nr:hypothetical protein [Salinivibrio sp. YCSC6]
MKYKSEIGVNIERVELVLSHFAQMQAVHLVIVTEGTGEKPFTVFYPEI